MIRKGDNTQLELDGQATSPQASPQASARERATRDQEIDISSPIYSFGLSTKSWIYSCHDVAYAAVWCTVCCLNPYVDLPIRPLLSPRSLSLQHLKILVGRRI